VYYLTAIFLKIVFVKYDKKTREPAVIWCTAAASCIMLQQEWTRPQWQRVGPWDEWAANTLNCFKSRFDE